MKKDLKDFVYVFEATAGELAMLVGPLDENLRQIETAFDAKISRRGNHFRIAGAEAPKAFAVLQSCAARVHAGEEISVARDYSRERPTRRNICRPSCRPMSSSA